MGLDALASHGYKSCCNLPGSATPFPRLMIAYLVRPRPVQDPVSRIGTDLSTATAPPAGLDQPDVPRLMSSSC